MLIDKVEIQFKTGSGGSGAVEFNRTKMRPGSVGGSGGRGGAICLERE